MDNYVHKTFSSRLQIWQSVYTLDTANTINCILQQIVLGLVIQEWEQQYIRRDQVVLGLLGKGFFYLGVQQTRVLGKGISPQGSNNSSNKNLPLARSHTVICHNKV